MTTSEQAALLAKHRAIEDDGSVHAALYAGDCVECDSPLPCDVHRMAELKDAEIAELREIIDDLRVKRDNRGNGGCFFCDEAPTHIEKSPHHKTIAVCDNHCGKSCQAKMDAAMADFSAHTTPGGTWIERSEDV